MSTTTINPHGLLKPGRYIIKPAQAITESQQIIPGQYPIDGKQVYLLNGFRVSSTAPEMGSGNSKYNIIFSKSEPQKVIEITLNDFQHKDKSDFILALRQHEAYISQDPSNPNRNMNPSVRSKFYIVSEAEQVDERQTEIKDKLRLVNLLNEMSFQELRDVAFAEGINPVGLNQSDLFVRFADFGQYNETDPSKCRKEGLLMKDTNAFFARHNNPERGYEVNIQKAIRLNIITLKNSYYYINEVLVGKVVEDVITYCKANKQIYETFIVPSVRKQDDIQVSSVKVEADNVARAMTNSKGISDEIGAEIVRKNDLQLQCRIKGIRYDKEDSSTVLLAALDALEKADEETKADAQRNGNAYIIGAERKRLRQEEEAKKIAADLVSGKVTVAEPAVNEADEKAKFRTTLKERGVKLPSPNPSYDTLKELVKNSEPATV